MFGRTKTQAVKDHAATSKEFALALSRDKKFRKQLLSAIGHGAKAKRRAWLWGPPAARETATDCCAEAACEGACGMLGVFALFHLTRAAVTDVRRHAGRPG